MDEIIPNLYISGLTPALNLTTLLTHHITHVLTLTTTPLPPSILRLYTTHSIQHTHLPTPSHDLLSIFPTTCDIISTSLSNDQPILIHCDGMRSRSAGVAVAYMMKVRMMGVVEGVGFVERRCAAGGVGMGVWNMLMVWEEGGWGIWEDREEGGEGCRRAKRVYLEWLGEGRERERGRLEGKGKGKEREREVGEV